MPTLKLVPTFFKGAYLNDLNISKGHTYVTLDKHSYKRVIEPLIPLNKKQPLHSINLICQMTTS